METRVQIAHACLIESKDHLFFELGSVDVCRPLQPILACCCLPKGLLRLYAGSMAGAAQLVPAAAPAEGEAEIQVLNWRSSRPGRSITWTQADVDP